jgi:hypothetical protein
MRTCFGGHRQGRVLNQSLRLGSGGFKYPFWYFKGAFVQCRGSLLEFIGTSAKFEVALEVVTCRVTITCMNHGEGGELDDCESMKQKRRILHEGLGEG